MKITAGVGSAIGVGVVSSNLGTKLAKKVAGEAMGEVGGTIGGNVGALALSLITQAASGQTITVEGFMEEVGVLIISEMLEQALKAAVGGPIGVIIIVVGIIGAILDSTVNPFGAMRQKDLDELRAQYHQSAVNKLYPLGMHWPLIVKPEILPLDENGKLLEPMKIRLQTLMKQYLDSKGLVTKNEVIERRLVSDLNDFREIRLMSTTTGTLVGSTINLGLDAQVFAARMVILLVQFRKAREQVAKNIVAREQQRKWEKVKQAFGVILCVLLTCSIITCCIYAMKYIG